MIMLRSIAALLLFVLGLPVHAESQPPPQPLGIGLEGFVYPFEVLYFPLTMESRPVKMAYMDVAPSGTANGRVALLLHGRNFSGFYWERTIRFLSSAGYRVVVPDQIGFGKSSKADIALSFHQLARNTRALLDHLGVERTIVIAHSMGCMLGARFALMYPQQVERLVLESPIGLEDYRLKVPYATNEELTREAAGMMKPDIDRFYRGYFVAWKPEYQIFADIQYRWGLGPDADLVNRTAAHTYQLAYEQPVLYELPLIGTRTLIVGGAKDRSAIGRNRVSPEVRETLGRFTELIPAAARAMPDAVAVVYENVGHIPHLEATERFHSELQSFLEH
jgi:pimeloyl-ACP methyl ester carboxylesterase